MILSCLSFFHIGANIMRKAALDKKIIQNVKEPFIRQVGLRYDITDKYDDKLNYDNKSNLPVFIIILTCPINAVKDFFRFSVNYLTG